MAEQVLPADQGVVVQPTASAPPAAGLPNLLRDVRTPNLRQLTLLVFAALALSLVVAGMMWVNQGTYRSIYPGMSDQDAAEVVAALEQANISFRLDMASGAVQVPEGEARRVMLMLAGRGLPRGSSGPASVQEEGFAMSSSREAERARLQQKLESDLAHTISLLGSVKSARVHLALAKESVFVRERTPPSASAVLNLFAGRVLSNAQVAAVAHLISSSVPNLSIDRISIIDQRGRLLSRTASQMGLSDGTSQLEFARQVEERYAAIIENILGPVVGAGKVRAIVSADIDFTRSEQTKEQFLPEESAVRSHKRREEMVKGDEAARGIPGAAANQVAGANNAQGGAEDGQLAGAGDERRKVVDEVINREVSKVVSHTKSLPVRVLRLSVAVVVDDGTTGEAKAGAAAPATQAQGGQGNAAQTAPAAATGLTPERLEEITQLVKDGIGFDESRGDRVTVITSQFHDEETFIEEVKLWETPAFVQWTKIGLAALGALLVLFLVVRPLVKTATRPDPAVPQLPAPEGGLSGGPVTGQLVNGTDEDLQLSGAGALDALKSLDDTHYESLVIAAQNVAEKDPKRVALAIERWLNQYE